MKLYVVTRWDLPPAQRAVQAIHAASNLAQQTSDDVWGPQGPHVVLMVTGTRRELEDLAETTSGVAFYEPDRDNELTAIAFLADTFESPVAHLL